MRARPWWGAAGAALFVAGDVLLLAAEEDPARFPLLERDDVDHTIGAMLPFSTRRLAAGALLGVAGAPLQAIGALDQLRALRLDRRNRVEYAVIRTAAIGQLAAGYVHGMFFFYGEAFKTAEAARADGAPDEQVARLVAAGHRVWHAIEVVYLPYLLLQGAASLLGSLRIARGETVYPRVAAGVVPPLLPAGGLTALTASHVIRHPVARSLQGAGLSLGNLVSFLGAAVLARR